MTDAEYESLKKRIAAMVEEWRSHLGLGQWRIQEYFHRTRDDYAENDNGNANRNAMGCCAVAWEYMDTCIHWNMDRINGLDYDDDDLRTLVVHELCHVLVNEMREWAPDEMDRERRDIGIKHEERVVTNLARNFTWVWDTAFKAGRNAKLRKKTS